MTSWALAHREARLKPAVRVYCRHPSQPPEGGGKQHLKACRSTLLRRQFVPCDFRSGYIEKQNDAGRYLKNGGRAMRWLIFFAGLVVLAGAGELGWAQAQDVFIKPVALPEPGPERDGLRLRLVVVKSAEKKDRHDFALEILNVSSKAVTLVVERAYETEDNSVASALRDNTRFHVSPDVVDFGYQTSGTFRQSPQPQVTIDAGKSQTFKWPVEGRRLHANELCWGLSFPVSGAFDIRAETVLKTRENKEILLLSNTQTFFSGGSNKAPRGCAGTVTDADAEKNQIRLEGVGPLNGVNEGDRFSIYMPMRGFFQLEITGGHHTYAWAKVVETEVFNPNARDAPKFPERGMKAALVVNPKWRASVTNGDKPGIGFLLNHTKRGLGGEFYILEPEAKGDFSKGVKYELLDMQQAGTTLKFNVKLQNGDKVETRAMQIELKEQLHDQDEVEATLSEPFGEPLKLKFLRED
jgi:hypothetical protein